MITPPKVACSIIIPTRDCLDYLPIALASIDMQRFDGLEVLIVDDGSSDGTAEWLAEAPQVTRRLKVLSTGGVGVVRARNLAIESAQGDLIAFLDADDYWWPGKLAHQLAFHRNNPSVGLTFTDYIHVTPDGQSHGTCFEFWKTKWGDRTGAYTIVENAEARLLATNVVGTSTVVARRDSLERLGGFSMSCKSAEDWDLWLRMAAVTDVACSNLVTMTYLMRPNGETSARNRRIDAMAEIVGRYAQSPNPKFRSAVQMANGRLDTARAEQLSAEGQLRSAAAAHWRAFVGAPSQRSLRAAMISGLNAAGQRSAARQDAKKRRA